MINYEPQPSTRLARLQLIEPQARLLGLAPAELSKAQELWLLDEALWERTARGLRESLDNIFPPRKPANGVWNIEQDRERNEWRSDHLLFSSVLAMEDCCQHLPLGNEFGAEASDKDIEHWEKAPGFDDSGFWGGMRPRGDKKGGARG